MSGKNTDFSKHGREDRLIKEEVHDPYMARCKPSEPTVCSECGVAFTGGRWQWVEESLAEPHMMLCPACQRIHDRVPAGYLTLGGSFFTAQKDEIMNLIQNHVEQQKKQHPMKRLINIEDQADDSMLLTFTDLHLVSSVGKAIESAYQGDFDVQYTDEASIVRGKWHRS